MQKPIGFVVDKPDQWIPPVLGSDYDQVNNSSFGYTRHVMRHVMDTKQVKAAPSGFFVASSQRSGRAFHFIESEEFEARLKFVGAPQNFELRDVERNNTLTMFKTEFLELIRTTSLANDRAVHGIWRFLKRGTTPGIALVRLVDMD